MRVTLRTILRQRFKLKEDLNITEESAYILKEQEYLTLKERIYMYILIYLHDQK